jgi:ubiquinol-cytochrome c reductase cytochrome b subunit
MNTLLRWIDDRLGASSFVRHSLDKIFPDHWSFMLGEAALYSFVVLVVTGIYLTFFYVPSVSDVVYNGKYAALRGLHMSQAYKSVIDISFQVRAGLVMRQMHHWAAIIFIGAIVLHLARVFFTGAFRRPRELNWVVGMLMLVLALANGFAGYSLPDDLLSGTGLRIAFSIMESIPIIGTWMAFLAFGGNYPSSSIISRLYILHVLLIPAAIAALLGVHLAKSIGFMLMVTAVIAALAGLAQINPVWLYGPYNPSQVSSASQPDWYMGWLEGALRVFPNWEIHLWGHSVGNVFFPGVLLPSITFGLLFAWPWIEARVTKDRNVHHLLDRPRDAPVRTAMGAAAIAFYGALFAAGGTDVLATTVHVSENSIIWTIRVALLILPIGAGLIVYRLCRELGASDAGPRRGPVEIVRTPTGGYESRPALQDSAHQPDAEEHHAR